MFHLPMPSSADVIALGAGPARCYYGVQPVIKGWPIADVSLLLPTNLDKVCGSLLESCPFEWSLANWLLVLWVPSRYPRSSILWQCGFDYLDP